MDPVAVRTARAGVYGGVPKTGPLQSGPVVTPKVTKPAPRSVAPRHRGHSLAPEHLGERGAAAAFVVVMGPTRRDLNLLAALGVATVAFGGATVVLARLRR